ncbi:hypothetical protein N9W61_03610, partial [Algibacter sp.]|nr:hypothetical protein [Algibacter sp.]
MKNFVLLILFAISVNNNCKAQNNAVNDFVPEGYTIYETNYGDLNKDGQEDCILIIKGTDKDNIVIDRYDKTVDRNRRGIVILFKNQDSYKLAAINQDCFTSENEDGGIYFPPELYVDVKKGNLVIHYA